MRRSVRFASMLPGVLCVLLSLTATAATIPVNSTADGAPVVDATCTLREAILSANGNASIGGCTAGSGADTITFAIPGGGPHTIAVSGATGYLPPITSDVFIDGFSQSGAAANSAATGNNAVYRVRIDGTGVVADASYEAWGLILAPGSAGSEIRGLVITNFAGGGIVVESSNNVIHGNFIGTDVTGTSALPNGTTSLLGGIRIRAAVAGAVEVSGNSIGGPAPADRNLISGNAGEAAVSALDLDVFDAIGVFGVVIQNNYIGTNAAGTAKLGPGGEGGNPGNGISSFDVNGLTIGGTAGTTPGGSCTGVCNLISGNIIGINAQSKFPPPGTGLVLIQGNFIGTDVTGTVALGSYDEPGAVPQLSAAGIRIGPGITTTIGGQTAAARNVISGHNGSDGHGINLQTAGTVTLLPVVVEGNYIGVNSAGTAVLPNGGSGVRPFPAENVTIGGATAASRNVISGNLGTGILMTGDDDFTNGNTIRNNYIGVLPDGVTAAGNGGAGIRLVDDPDGPPDNVVIRNNIIANNGGAGVALESNTDNNSILSNSIYGNGGLGIDLEANGTQEPNDNCDPDTGANDRQNHPVITSATLAAGSVTIIGTLNSLATSGFTVEFFGNPGGGNEGRVFLGSAAIATNGACSGAFNSGPIATSLVAGDTVTATATNQDVFSPDTSEFSAAALLAGDPPVVTKSFTPSTIGVNGTSTLSITIQNAGSSPLTNVSFTDTYPGAITTAGVPNITGNCGGTTGSTSGSFTLTGGSIAGSGSCTVTIDVTSGTAGMHANNVSVTTNETGPGAGNANLTVLASPTVAKSFSPDPVAAGATSTLTITLGNTNATSITGAAFTDTFPAGLVVGAPNNLVNNCGGSVTATAGTGTVSLAGGVIPSGGCTIVVDVTSATSGLYTNTIPVGGVTSTNAGPNTVAGSDTITFTGPITATKSFTPSSIAPGGTSTLTITIANPNPFDATSAGFTDTYPAAITNSAAPNASTTCIGGTLTAAATGPSLQASGMTVPANSSCTVTVQVTSNTAGAHLNSIPAGDITSANAGSTTSATQATLTVNSPPVVAKSFSPPAIAAGQTTTLTITLTNNNAVALTNAAFADNYPAGLVNANVPAATTCPGGTASAAPGGSTLSLSGGTIPANGSCTVTAGVTAAIAQSYVNTLPAGSVTVANAGASGAASSATLIVDAANADVPMLSPFSLVLIVLVLAISGAIALKR